TCECILGGLVGGTGGLGGAGVGAIPGGAAGCGAGGTAWGAVGAAAGAVAGNAIAAESCSNEPDCVRASAFHLAGAKINDPEEFKKGYVGNAGGTFDICACKDGTIVLAAVGQCGRSGPKIG